MLITIIGPTAGVDLAVFTLGITVPIANRKGTITAVVIALGMCLELSVR